ncbi:Aspartic peptidase [Corchorus capsularis]|uniref:Aspartic peptidase n=1 Tax=Corchorus capsularis TaxID=210143 RepID=A0A1R3G361_COCAP|nr:Aspartic peptidase [Corchorus capsularis]
MSKATDRRVYVLKMSKAPDQKEKEDIIVPVETIRKPEGVSELERLVRCDMKTKSGRVYLPKMSKAVDPKNNEDILVPVETRREPEVVSELEREAVLIDRNDRIHGPVRYDRMTKSGRAYLPKMSKAVDQKKKEDTLVPEAHRNVLLQVLSQSYVSQNISVNDMDRLVGNISATGFIPFSEKEIPEGMRNNMKALHITVKCKNISVAHVLIDNSSALNIMPLKMVKRLSVKRTDIQTNHMTVRAFDGTRKSVIGEVEIPIEVGSMPFNLRFQVLNIDPSYSCLLGRPWIHLAGAIPSSLHQIVKFLTPEKLVEVHGEKDYVVASTSGFSYVEPPEESYECSFRAFEVAQVIPKSPTNYSIISIQIMKKNGWKEGRGLWRNLQGVTKIVTIPIHDSIFGLGYKPTTEDRAEVAKWMKQRRLARMGGEVDEKRMEFPPLFQTFRSSGWVNKVAPQEEQTIEEKLQGLTINVITEELSEDDECPWIRQLAPGEVLNNWVEYERAILISDLEM